MTTLTKEMGLWIDHKQAVIVPNIEDEAQHIDSHVEKHVRFSGGARSDNAGGSYAGSPEDNRENRFHEELNRYYDEIISHLHEATSILIMGPGEAKIELQKRLKERKIADVVVVIETADKMTDRQIMAEVRDHFQALHKGKVSL